MRRESYGDVLWDGTEKDRFGTIGGFGVAQNSISTWQILEAYLRLWRDPAPTPKEPRGDGQNDRAR